MIVSSDEEIYEKKYGTTLFRKPRADRKSTRLNSSHSQISYAVFCLKKKNHQQCSCSRRASFCFFLVPTPRTGPLTALPGLWTLPISIDCLGSAATCLACPRRDVILE